MKTAKLSLDCRGNLITVSLQVPKAFPSCQWREEKDQPAGELQVFVVTVNFRKALRIWNVSTHPSSIFSFFLLNKLLDFLNNKILYQEGRSVMQFEHCRHLPFKGKEHKLEHGRNRDIKKVRLLQGQDRHTERTIPAVEGNCHPCKYE